MINNETPRQGSTAKQGQVRPMTPTRERVALPTGHRPYAFIAEFDNVAKLADAAEKVRDANYIQWDVHCPMPIHGMNVRMGLRPTILPWISLAHGVVGLLFGLVMVWWINAFTIPWIWTPFQGYEFAVSGKPTFSLPANMAVIFETTVLFTAIGTILGMCGLNRLPMLHNPLFRSERFRRATSDGLFVVIEASDPQFDLLSTHEFLVSLGPRAIELIADVDGPAREKENRVAAATSTATGATL